MCRILSNKSKASLPYLVSSTEYHWMPLLYIHKKILPICHSSPQTVKINGTLHAKWHTKKAFFNEFMTNWCSVGVRFVIYKTLYTYIIFILFTYPPCADTHILKYDAKPKKHIYDIDKHTPNPFLAIIRHGVMVFTEKHTCHILSKQKYVIFFFFEGWQSLYIHTHISFCWSYGCHKMG